VLVLRAAAVLVTIVLAAAAAAGVTWRHGRDDRNLAAQYRHTLAVAHGRYLTAAAVTAAPAGTEVGHAFAYQGEPSWIFLALTAAPVPGAYDVRVVTTDGRTVHAGTCTVTGRDGSYGTDVAMRVRAIQRVELVKPGAPTLTARFH
jgi:hypothetical protein